MLFQLPTWQCRIAHRRGHASLFGFKSSTRGQGPPIGLTGDQTRSNVTMKKNKADRSDRHVSGGRGRGRHEHNSKAADTVLPRGDSSSWKTRPALPGTAQLIQEIDCVFDGVPPPDQNHRTLFQAEAWDSYNTCSQKHDHRGKWQDLPSEHLVKCQWALPHLDEQGIHYYLPAVMIDYLRTPPEKRTWLHESLGYTIDPATVPNLQQYQRERFFPLSVAQRRAILNFAHYSGASQRTIAAWARAVEAGDRPDWVNSFHP